MLNVVIGLVLIFLLYSLFATTILELLSSLLALRGKHLERAIRNMLDSGGNDVFDRFRDNALYKQLSGRFVGKTSPPSYLSSEKFRSILFQAIGQNQEPGKLDELIERVPDGGLKSVLQQLRDDAQGDLESFKQRVELWFNDVMDRASGWYKRSIQSLLVFLGMGIAVAFNVDSLQIYGQLSHDPDLANQMALEAVKVVAGRDTLVLAEQPAEIQKQLYEVVSQNLEALKSPLGIGWDNVVVSEMSVADWFLKGFGWLVTAMAISLGAPFWFDILKKMVNIRSSGKAIDGK